MAISQEYKKIIMNMFQNHQYLIVFDVETTGLSVAKDFIIQFAAKRYEIIKENNKFALKKDDEFTAYIKPPITVKKEIEDLTGITNEFLADKETEDVVIPKIVSFFAEKPCMCTAYNNKFDEAFLFEAGLRNGYALLMDTTKENVFTPFAEVCKFDSFDTFIMTKLYIDKNEISNRKLETVAKYLQVMPSEENFHSADFDVEITGRIIQTLLNRENDDKTEIMKMTVQSFSYWDGPNHKLQRIYVNGSNGEAIFYDQYAKEWRMKDKSKKFVYDIADIERQCSEAIHSSIEEFHNYKEKNRVFIS